MKKIALSVFTMLLAILLVACGGKYSVDGEFTAFDLGVNNGVPMLTTVTVTIKDGEVTAYNIDSRQGKVDAETGEFAWNAKTKKELGFGYHMHGQFQLNEADYKAYLQENNLLEWFEQANLLEAKFLADGPESVTVDEDGYIDSVAGVSVTVDVYTRLAKEALENAKSNKVIAYEVGLTNAKGPQFTWIELTVKNNGKDKAVFFDVVQSTKSTEGKFSWNEKSKKELKFDYGMKDSSDIGKEWFEQAATLEKFILKNGIDKVVVKDGYIDGISGVSVKDGGYTNVYKAARKLIK